MVHYKISKPKLFTASLTYMCGLFMDILHMFAQASKMLKLLTTGITSLHFSIVSCHMFIHCQLTNRRVCLIHSIVEELGIILGPAGEVTNRTVQLLLV